MIVIVSCLVFVVKFRASGNGLMGYNSCEEQIAFVSEETSSLAIKFLPWRMIPIP